VLKGGGARGPLEILSAPASAELGKVVHYRVRVRNTGPTAWAADGPGAVRLAYRWRHAHLDIQNGPPVPLPGPLEPGAEADLDCSLVSPHTVGRYTLEFSLAGGGEAGSFPTVKVPCRITGANASAGQAGFNYQDFYRQSDLDTNYWSVVGPGSKEEFEALGKAKLQMLISLGLLPSSRVLDVGCGTGLLTGPLADYLGPDGLYHGTDIAEEAVAFCRRRFARPTFHFSRNDMTTVPIEGVEFDLIYLGSVFTHLFPEEVRALLRHLALLLAGGGILVADAFVSSAPEPFRGTRSLVEINEPLFQDILRGTGLACEVLARNPWHETAWRLHFKLTRREIG
jgi:SAM-dependent methyltransferase